MYCNVILIPYIIKGTLQNGITKGITQKVNYSHFLICINCIMLKKSIPFNNSISPISSISFIPFITSLLIKNYLKKLIIAKNSTMDNIIIFVNKIIIDKF